MKVLVTGANGFVGSNIVEALVEAGHAPVAYVRPGARLDILAQLGAQVRLGGLDDPAGLRGAMRDVDAVIHTAGNTSTSMRDAAALGEVNVLGTARVAAAAREAQVKRFVLTSTTATIGSAGRGDRVANEKTRNRGFRARSPYAITKRRAEEIVLRESARGLNAVILNPAEVLGRYDRSLQWGQLVLAVRYNQIPFVPTGGASFCNALDVGRAHVSALTRGRTGERYILAGRDIRFIDLADRIAKVLGVDYDAPVGSYRAMVRRSRLQEYLPRKLWDLPPVQPHRLRVFADEHYFSSAKAERELGYRSATIEAMIADCADFYVRDRIMMPAGHAPLATAAE